MRKKTFNKLIADEKGQALILVLILMLVGGLIIAPLLAYMGTGVQVGKEVFEEKMYGQYAADSGVEDALYKIKVGDLPTEWDGMWDENDYNGDPYEYSTPQLDGNDIGVSIQPYWILTGLEDPPPGMTPHSDLVVVGDSIGTVGSNGLYQISINYDSSIGQLKIERIGAWLPATCTYVEGSSNLEAATGKAHCVPVLDDYRGGRVITWDYSSPHPNFTDLPGSGDKRIVTFEFTPSQAPVSAFSWVRAQSMDIYLSWDADIKTYQITSQATDIISDKSVTVEAYASRNELRDLGSTIWGDYVAVGNTLMEATSTGSEKIYRDRLYMQSSATIQSSDAAAPGYIPAGATVEAAYLYWSGWIDYHCQEKYKHGHQWRWRWGEIKALEYPNNPTLQKLTDLVEDDAKVNRVTLLFGSGAPVTITVNAPDWQVMENTTAAGTWSYSCFYNATDLVKQLIASGDLGSNGSGLYTVQHVPEDRPGYTGESPNYYFELYDYGQYTGYPLGTPARKLPGKSSYSNPPPYYEWAYAGWSLLIIYSSPQTKGHQLYLYDDFLYCDNDQTLEFPISGFLAPEEIKVEGYAAHLTCFVGEGDEVYANDYIKVNGTSLSNSASPVSNVWNSKSPGFTVDGVDVDTFTVGYPTINPGDTLAQVTLPTGTDSWNLVYIILSFRSNVKTSGAISYMYVGGG